MRTKLWACTATLLVGSGLAYADMTAPAQSGREKHGTEGAKPTETTPSAISGAQNVETFFATDSAQLSPDATADLQKLADWAKCDTRNAIILEGYADPRGTKAHNLKLSGERAAAVRLKLVEMGVPSARIVVTLYGKNGMRLATFADERRVVARAAATPVEPADLAASTSIKRAKAT